VDIVQHSSETFEWYTPEYIVEMARAVLGSIDFDPATSVEANEVIKAGKILTEGDDALSCEWPQQQSIFMNPPGKKSNGNKSMAGLFWAKLMEQDVKHAIVICFNLNQLALTQSYHKKSMLEFPICIPRKRLSFNRPQRSTGKVGSPSHNNAIIYVPNTVDNTDKFVEIFSSLGKVKV
jgi:ParB family chromosome partitioning protein